MYYALAVLNTNRCRIKLRVVSAETDFRQKNRAATTAVYELLIAKIEMEKAKGELLK